jgi:hypothetical protein
MGLSGFWNGVTFFPGLDVFILEVRRFFVILLSSSYFFQALKPLDDEHSHQKGDIATIQDILDSFEGKPIQRDAGAREVMGRGILQLSQQCLARGRV